LFFGVFNISTAPYYYYYFYYYFIRMVLFPFSEEAKGRESLPSGNSTCLYEQERVFPRFEFVSEGMQLFLQDSFQEGRTKA